MNAVVDDSEFLVLADGTKIAPDGKVVKEPSSAWTEIPSPSKAQEIVVRARKSVNELPMPPQQMTAIGLVAFYTLFGLNDTDIAIALDGRLTEEQIKNIRGLTAYTDFMLTAKTNLLETETNTVRELFTEHAIGAAKQIIDIAKNGENEVIQFKASQDILDRAGHRPADIVEHRHKLEDALHIIVEKKDSADQVPVIDVTAEEIV